MVPCYIHLQGEEGFTGEKGIGIKSVFSVCDTYEIHSNGFHIGFDKRLSIVEPYNIREDAKCIQNIFYPDNRGSALRLPFTRGIFQSVSAELRKICLEDLLLFTRKICYFETKESQRLVRETISVDAKRSWIKFSHSNPDAQSYWYVKTTTCTPSQKRTERHKGFVGTKVSIAIRFERKDSGSRGTSDGECDGASNDGDNECDDESKGAANSDTDDDGCWVTSGVTERPLLCFPEAPKLHPIYAFLPTQECIFPFALQGNFILTANKEALTDCIWNRELLSKVPKLFIEVMLDLAGALKNRFYEDRAAAVCLLSEHPSTAGAATGAGAVLGVSANSPRYDIDLSWADILSLLPRSSSKDLFKHIVNGIYEALCEMPFLLSSTGAPWCSSKLIMGSVLFNPAELIPEGLLERCTGKRFLHRMVAPIDREIIKLLRITALDVNTVYHCIEATSKEQSPPLSLSQSPLPTTPFFFPLPSISHSEDNSSTYPDLIPIPIHILAGLLLALVKLSAKREEAKLICDKLRGLQIWPTATSCVRVSLEGKVVYIPGKIKSRCLSLLPPDLVTLIDIELFLQADKLALGGAAHLQIWLLLNFKPRCNRTDRGSYPFGGIELLSLHAVALNDINPLFERVKRNRKGNEKEKEKWIENARWDEKEMEKKVFELNRVTAAACMAILFLSNAPLGDSAIMPTLQASGNTAEGAMLWSNAEHDRESHLRTSIKSTKNQGKRLIEGERGTHEEEEVHLGLESEDSAVCCMERQGLKSILQQVTPQAPTSVYHKVVHILLLSTSLTFSTSLFLISHSITCIHLMSALFLI
jgi:hypothetical protein